jgi:divalent metal cation (Fe/Co/Zn/Cd) transporter
LDSGVESLSASVVLWRLYAERRDPERAEAVEQRALRLIGVTFFVLGAFIAVEAVRSIVTRQEPDASVVGIVLTTVSIVVMQWLARAKRRIGIEMGSRAVTADSSQTSACVYLSIVVLAGLVLNAAFGWWWADPLAALGVVVFLVREGREALASEHADNCC